MAHILVIDDSSMVRISLRAVLESAGHTVDEAGDGEEGLNLSKNAPYDVVITDILMPKTDGIEVLRNMKEANKGSKVIVISAGGYTDAQKFYHTADALGADKVLAKPVRKNDLLGAVDSCLTGGEPQERCC